MTDKFLKLTRVLADVNEKGKRKIEDFVKEKYDFKLENLPTDEEGRTAEWYENLGMPVPEELQGNNNTNSPVIQFEGEIDVNLDRDWETFGKLHQI